MDFADEEGKPLLQKAIENKYSENLRDLINYNANIIIISTAGEIGGDEILDFLIVKEG